MRILIAFVTGFLVWLAAPAALRGQDISLPDLGSSAEALATPQELHRYGRQLLGSFRDARLLFDDPLLDEYMESLGYRLVAQADARSQYFKFFLIRDRTINAFAAPGGFIGTYAGMVLMVESEDELAAVTAHEIAHITQNHALRGAESASKASLPIMLGMLAAAIAASQSGSNSSGDAMQAAIVSGMGLLQQAQINYTRANEYEADRIGVQTLSRAGFDPAAVSTLWGRMMRQSRNYGLSPPEILRTHPMETTRIAEAKARADAIPTPARAEVDIASLASLDGRFELFQERMRVLMESAGDQTRLVTRYRERLREDADNPFLSYGLALSLQRREAYAQSERIVDDLVRRHPDTLAFQLLKAEIEGRTGNERAALARYETLDDRHPGRAAILAPYAELLLKHGDREQAAQAAVLLRPMIERDTDHAQLYALIGRAYELGGDTTRAAEAHALSAAYNGRFEDSLGQFERIQRRPDLDYYQRARVEARIVELTPLVMEIRRRSIRPAGAQQSYSGS